jgi:hypothetical protein
MRVLKVKVVIIQKEYSLFKNKFIMKQEILHYAQRE